MKGLLLKDIYVVTKQLTIFLFVIPALAFMGNSTMSTFAVLLSSVLPMTAIAYDERCKWHELAVTMPYAKRDLVLNKYLLGYLCMLGALAILILGKLISSFLGRNSTENDFNTLLFAIFGGLLFIAVNTPVLFKFGSEKGRFIFIIAMVLIGASGPMLAAINPEILILLQNISPLMLLCVAIALNVVSIMISVKIKPKTR